MVLRSALHTFSRTTTRHPPTRASGHPRLPSSTLAFMPPSHKRRHHHRTLGAASTHSESTHTNHTHTRIRAPDNKNSSPPTLTTPNGRGARIENYKNHSSATTQTLPLTRSSRAHGASNFLLCPLCAAGVRRGHRVFARGFGGAG